MLSAQRPADRHPASASHYDTIVIGGGLIGMLTARELLLAGQSVVVVESGRVGCQSSWAGGGILSPLYPWRYPAAVRALAIHGHHHYPRLVDSLRREGGGDAGYLRSGMLLLDPPAALDGLDQWVADCDLHAEECDRQRLQSLLPPPGTPFERGVLLPGVGQVRNPRLVSALRRSLIALGGEIREGAAVTSLLVDGSRLRGVDLAGERLSAPRVVVAAGAWSANLLNRFGLAPPAVEPVRGQMLLLRAGPGFLRRMVLAAGRYLIPRDDGRILIGSTLERVGFDRSVTSEAASELLSSACSIIPALTRFRVERQWAGLRPGSPDGVPTISAHPQLEGLYLNCGHYRNGVILGPASARLLADLLLGREPLLDPAPCRLALP